MIGRGNKYRYLFGPVPSRRFGRSLGIDMVPFKTCSLNCIFCQLGRTRKQTIDRKEYVSIGGVLHELEDWLQNDGVADYITLSGSGEPTLHSGFGQVLKFLKNVDIPCALLTNGTMLSVPEVRKAASFADVVKISLSAWDQRSFEWINRPHQKLRFIQILQGQKDFRKQYKNELWMEVFLVQGFNSMPKDVEKIIAHIKELRPNRIHLNTAVRPPAEDFVRALTKDRMDEIACLFDPPAEVILKEYSAKFSTRLKANEDSILAMLKRRPCTSDQIATAFGMHINEVSKYLGNLLTANQIRADRKDNHLFYFAVNKEKATELQS